MSDEGDIWNFPQVGGSEEAFLAAKPLFLSMGKSAIYCGGAGTGSVGVIVIIGVGLLVLPVAYITLSHILILVFGFCYQAAKICNNLAMAVSMLGISEALALGQSLGVAASTLTKIFNCSSARCWSRYAALF